MHFAIIRKDKPNHLNLRLTERPNHLKYLATVLDTIVYGGALLDNDSKQIGSILVIDVEDEAAAERFAAGDPYVDVGLFASTEIVRFRPVFRDGAWL